MTRPPEQPGYLDASTYNALLRTRQRLELDERPFA